MKPHICTFTVSAKKGDSQTARFHIQRDVPYPRLNGIRGCIEWESAENILPSWRNNNQPSGIPDSYYCYLMRSNLAEGEQLDGSRKDHAGYTYQSSYSGPEVKNPGSLVYRGREIGETVIHIEMRGANQWNGSPYIRCDAVSGSESDWFKAQVYPPLLAYIEANKTSLYAESLDKLKAYIANEIAESREELEAAEKQMLEALSKL